MRYQEKETPFYLFGLGGRDKYIYTEGKLYHYPETEPVLTWQVQQEEILPADYTVRLTTEKGTVLIYDNEEGLYLRDTDGAERCLSRGHVTLPTFDGYTYREQLRVLHGELCVNVIGGKPVPNFLVYQKPWYRDGAMMALAFEKTGNLALISDWAASLTEMYDRNNAGNEEPDNLGQLLCLLALTGNRSHPLISKAVDEAKRRITDGVLTGITDGAEHPVYQTKWLKFGLDLLGLDSSFVRIPDVPDSYGVLFWMDGHREPMEQPAYCENYPYLTIAACHTGNLPVPERELPTTYPMTSETWASEAKYEKQLPYFPALAAMHSSAPHTWHAAELFLYLLEFRDTVK